MRRPRIEGKIPGINEGGSPPPVKPGETMADAAKRLGIQTADQAQKDLENEEWEKAEWEAKKRAAEEKKKEKN